MDKKVSVPAGMQLEIQATGEFYVEEVLADGTGTRLRGPNSSTARRLVLGSSLVDRNFRVWTVKEGHLQVDQVAAARSSPGGGDPVSVPFMNRPLTLQEEMKRFIREEVSRMAGGPDVVGTAEEEDDFDVDDGDDLPQSQYEFHDMTPEFPASKPAPSAGAVPKGSSPAGGSDAQTQAPVESNPTPGVHEAPASAPSQSLAGLPGSSATVIP